MPLPACAWTLAAVFERHNAAACALNSRQKQPKGCGTVMADQIRRTTGSRLGGASREQETDQTHCVARAHGAVAHHDRRTVTVNGANHIERLVQQANEA